MNPIITKFLLDWDIEPEMVIFVLACLIIGGALIWAKWFAPDAENDDRFPPMTGE